jgi:hypothetical protein
LAWLGGINHSVRAHQASFKICSVSSSHESIHIPAII